MVLWVGDGRTEDAVEAYFTEELGTETLPHARDRLYGHVGGLRQPGAAIRPPGPDPVRPLPHHATPYSIVTGL